METVEHPPQHSPTFADGKLTPADGTRRPPRDLMVSR